MTVSGGDIDVDFTGTSPQVRGPFNCVPSGSLAAACFAVRALTDPTIPTNGGCFRPITLALPEGSLVNPVSRRRSMRAPHDQAHRRLHPRRASRKSCPTECRPTAAGNAGAGLRRSAPTATRYVIGELVAGGSGAAPRSDGVDVIETDATNCMNLPAEAIEMEAPIRVNRVALRHDSGGAGRHRGGLGMIREYEMLRRRGALHPSRRAPFLSRARGRAGGATVPWHDPSSSAPAAARRPFRRRS